jgi:hypothetical protein
LLLKVRSPSRNHLEGALAGSFADKIVFIRSISSDDDSIS